MKPQKVKVQRKPQASGFMMSFVRATITRNGVTEVIRDERIEKRLVNGEWVDVKRSIK